MNAGCLLVAVLGGAPSLTGTPQKIIVALSGYDETAPALSGYDGTQIGLQGDDS